MCLILAHLEFGLVDSYSDLHVVQEIIKIGYINTSTPFDLHKHDMARRTSLYVPQFVPQFSNTNNFCLT